MAVPKRRTTRAKSKMRRAQHDKVTAPNIAPCSNCGEPSVTHRVCASCGFYKGAKVVETGKLALVLRPPRSGIEARRGPQGDSRISARSSVPASSRPIAAT